MGGSPAGELAPGLHIVFGAWSPVEHCRSGCQHLGGPLVVWILEHQLPHLRVPRGDYTCRTCPALEALFAHIGIVSKNTASSRGYVLGVLQSNVVLAPLQHDLQFSVVLGSRRQKAGPGPGAVHSSHSRAPCGAARFSVGHLTTIRSKI